MVPLYTDPVRVARINDEIPQYRESTREYRLQESYRKSARRAVRRNEASW